MKKKLIVTCAAAALSAAAAVPAFALENEFHGMYKLKAFLSNADNGGAGQVDLTKRSATAANYFDQRFRLLYTAKANDTLKLVTAFEVDMVWGDQAMGAAQRNTGGALDTDKVNLETKWIHLDFMIPSTPVNMKIGTQAYKDSLKGIWMDCDAAGIYATAKYGAATSSVGYFRGYEGLAGGQSSPRGTDNLDIGVLEGKYALSKELTLGGAYYLLSDYRTVKPITYHTFGVNADAKVGPAALSGFVAYQTGFNRNQTTSGAPSGANVLGASGGRISAWAANVAAKVQAGPGTAKAAFLITSGDKGADSVDHSWQSVVQSVNGPNNGGTLGTYTENGMILLQRNPAAGGTTSDRTIIYNMGNKGRGATILSAGYDATLSPKVFATANVGVGMTTENQTGDNGSHYQGTEVNAEVGYKIYDNLTATVQAAYVFLGNFYDNKATGGGDPVNPYTTRINLTYAF